MNNKKEMICIMCPMGCELLVEQVDGKINVSGNTCNRGITFAEEELTSPKRMVTTSVKTEKGVKACKTSIPVPKDKVFAVVAEVEKLRLKSAKYGQIIIKNVLDTGADVIVTAND
jgi:CxxC motif-containing protein